MILTDAERHSRLVKQTRKIYQLENPGSRLFPNTSGVAWQGHAVFGASQVIIKNPRPICFGIPSPKMKHEGTDSGGADLIGETLKEYLSKGGNIPLLLPVLTAIECKTGKAKLKRNQKLFHDWILSVNGIYYISRECPDCRDKWEPVKLGGVIVDWKIPLCKTCGGNGFVLETA